MVHAAPAGHTSGDGKQILSINQLKLVGFLLCVYIYRTICVCTVSVSVSACDCCNLIHDSPCFSSTCFSGKNRPFQPSPFLSLSVSHPLLYLTPLSPIPHVQLLYSTWAFYCNCHVCCLDWGMVTVIWKGTSVWWWCVSVYSCYFHFFFLSLAGCVHSAFCVVCSNLMYVYVIAGWVIENILYW